MKTIHRCEFCGKRHVKLWKPSNGSEPLFCTRCAHQRQSGKPLEMIDQIRIELFGEIIILVPAIPDKNDTSTFLKYGSITEDIFKKWDKLPE